MISRDQALAEMQSYQNRNISNIRELRLINTIYDMFEEHAKEYESAINNKNDRIKELEQIGIDLWAIIDDIDTYGDMAKGDDVLYRSMVQQRQSDRFKFGVTDGIDLWLGSQYVINAPSK